MKRVGVMLIAVGLALFVFVLFNLLKENNRLHSPIPESSGVKVIFVTPTKSM